MNGTPPLPHGKHNPNTVHAQLEHALAHPKSRTIPRNYRRPRSVPQATRQITLTRNLPGRSPPIPTHYGTTPTHDQRPQDWGSRG
ncbi:hypothetical protein GCM10022222_48800 [Amycolatopsis ultiminotia]|uniref:Uncharacterized protein n=1 Tax=Amycolatopsis ultiminotia TaxID=543629 RepID=A0ABP6X1M4_9PSEU